MTKPTPEQLRSLGYAADAEIVEISDLALIAFAAWVNLPVDKLPDFIAWKPVETAKAWERVAEAIKMML